jgi:glycosyltransferase involved in cell wall biosynthesis
MSTRAEPTTSSVSSPLGDISIAMVGMTAPRVCGVRDYASRLSVELRHQGIRVCEYWFTSDGRSLVSTLRASLRLLRLGLSVPREQQVVWHYSTHVYAFRSIPMPGVLFGLLLRLRGVGVVTVLHEMVLPWSVSGRKKFAAILHRFVVPFLLIGCSSAIVTTEERAAWLRPLSTLLRRQVHVLPVFSNIAVVPIEADDKEHGRILGVLGYGSGALGPNGIRADLLVVALRSLRVVAELSVELLGAPGPGSAAVEAWRTEARAAGVDDLIHVSGVLEPKDFSARLQRCTAIVLLYEDGPSSRRTMLAAALAHGLPVVAVDGHNRWEAVVEAHAIRLVPPHPDILASALAELLEDPDERAALGRRAAEFYYHHMRIERITNMIISLLLQDASSCGESAAITSSGL